MAARPSATGSIDSDQKEGVGTHMHIIGSGRDAFLEFLRNLTPQALLFSAGIVVLSLIKRPLFAVANIGYWALVVGLLLVVFLAAAANTWKFFDNAFSGSAWARTTMRRIRRLESFPRKRSWMFLVSSWRFKRVLFLEFFVAVAVVYSCLIAVLSMATHNTLRSLGAH
jgi:hypothetical protein